MLFDTHTHLNDPKFDEDREQVIERAREEYGVKYMLNVGYNRETIRQTLQLAETYCFIYASVGWHPVEAKDCTAEDLEWIKSMSPAPESGGVGGDRIGLPLGHLPQRYAASGFSQTNRHRQRNGIAYHYSQPGCG